MQVTAEHMTTSDWLREFAEAVEKDPQRWHEGYQFWLDSEENWITPGWFPHNLTEIAMKNPDHIRRAPEVSYDGHG